VGYSESETAEMLYSEIQPNDHDSGKGRWHYIALQYSYMSWCCEGSFLCKTRSWI